MRLQDYIQKEPGGFFIKEDYSKYALNQAHNIITGKISDNAEVDRRKVEAITIDGIESMDLDDAIWIEKLKNGYLIQIHIASPTSKIDKYSPLDLEAIERGFTIYTGSIHNIYPRSLAEDYFSLNEGGKKLTLSIDVKIDKLGNVENFEIYESELKNIKRYNYEEFIEDYINPEAERHKNLQLMYKVAKILRKKRKKSGAHIDFHESERSIALIDSERQQETISSKIPKIIVEECAILGNICSIMYIVKKDLQRVFRVHQKLDEAAWYDTKHPGHTGLGLDFYTHFTSPIRRYPDNIIHRVLRDSINNRNSIYENEEIKQIVNFVNMRLFFIKGFLSAIEEEKDWGSQKIEMIKSKFDDKDIHIGHYKPYIRNTINDGESLPRSLKREFKKMIIKGNIKDFSWCIGLFLLSDEKEIKSILKKRIIDDLEISPKKIIAILNNTKLMKSDKLGVFHIEQLDNEGTNTYKIITHIQGKNICTLSEEYGNLREKKYIKGCLRRETVENIFTFYLDKNDTPL